MHTIDVHYDMQAPLEHVWPFLEDFADILAWWPEDQAKNIERVELEGEGIGQIRHIYNVGYPDPNLTYHSEFIAGEGKDESARKVLLGLYQLMFRGLDAAAKRRRA